MSNKKGEVGRPPIYKNEEDLQADIEGYFKWCVDNEKMPTMAGLALHIDVLRDRLYEWEKERFPDTIKKARTQIESMWAQLLATKNATGAIFMLKNFGWSDKQEMEMTGSNIKVTVEGRDEE